MLALYAGLAAAAAARGSGLIVAIEEGGSTSRTDQIYRVSQLLSDLATKRESPEPKDEDDDASPRKKKDKKDEF